METKTISRQDLISKRHLAMVKKFNQDLISFAEETGVKEAELYEDATTMFTLSDVKVEDGYLKFKMDGEELISDLIEHDEEEDSYYEDEGFDGIVESVKYWRGCLRRAKRYWAMDSETLDKIQEGELEDKEDNED